MEGLGAKSASELTEAGENGRGLGQSASRLVAEGTQHYTSYTDPYCTYFVMFKCIFML